MMEREYDLPAIRQTLNAAQKKFEGEYKFIKAMELTKRYHDINSAQLYAITGKYITSKLTDSEIVEKLPLLKSEMTVLEVWQAMGLDLDPNFYK